MVNFLFTGGLVKTSKTAEEEKLARKEFSHMIENAERGLKSAEEGLQTVSNEAFLL